VLAATIASLAVNARRKILTPQKKREPRGNLSALEGDLRKALGRSFLRWEKDKVKKTTTTGFQCLGCSL
jgi:hypothetical protein